MTHVGVKRIITLAAAVLIRIDVGISERRHAEVDKCVAQRRVAATAARRPGVFHDLGRAYMAALASGPLAFAGRVRLSGPPIEGIVELTGLE